MMQPPREPRISIAMATYNGARFLPEQLASFVAQERLPDELVVCDDCSTDATIDILNDFAASAPFTVRVERNDKNIGYVRNFEKALSLCTGDIVFMSDHDDVWLPSKLGRVEQVFKDDPMVMATINDMIITDAELRHSNVTQLGNLAKAGWGEHLFIWGCAMAVRKPMLDALLPFPEMRCGHDTWIGEVVSQLGVKKVIYEVLQLYRRHGKNESQSMLSDPKGVSQTKLFAQVDLASPLSGWDIHFHFIDIKRTRLIERRYDFEMLGLGDRIDPALADLERQESDIRTRVDMLRTPRFRRFPSVLRFWAAGRYSRFSGWKSAVKDLVRP